MKIINTKIEQFPRCYRGKRIICFGAGATGKIICETFEKEHIAESISYFVDNDPEKWEDKIAVCGKEYSVYSPVKLKQEDFSDTIIFVTSRFWHEIVKQLESYMLPSDVECYVYILFKLYISEMVNPVELFFNREQCIPKVIHYCWFGKGKLPDFAIQCIESWKKYCPDYEIVEWNEKNYDVYKNRFTKEVYDYGHFSALSSYARFDIVNRYGGIYLDTDVEVVKSLDPLLYHDAFMGFEVSNYVNSGHGFGGKKGNAIFAENVDIYDHMTFYDATGKFQYKTAPVITTELLEKYGLKKNGAMQKIQDIIVYPSDYFDPAMQIPVETSYSVHKYSSLWSLKGKDLQRTWEEQRQYYFLLERENKIKERIW